MKTSPWAELIERHGEPNTRELQGEIEDLIDEAESLHDLAAKEERVFSSAEDERWKRLMGQNGTITQLYGQLKTMEQSKLRNEQLRIKNKDRKDMYSQTNFGTPPIALDDQTQTPNFQGVNVRTKNLKCFKGPNAPQDALVSGMFLRAIVAKSRNDCDQVAEQFLESRGMGIRMTATEGTATGGGYLVPDPLSQAIIDYRDEVGISRRAARVMPMTADTLGIPKRTGGLTVYAPGEASTITTSDKTWGRVELVTKKRAVAHKISQELVDDAIIGIVDDAMAELGYAIADQEDGEFINGDATSSYFMVNGLLNKLGSAGVSTAATGNDTWAELTITDITNMMTLLPSKYLKGAKWICSGNFFFSTMTRLMAEGGGNAITDISAGVTSRSFLGYEVLDSDKMPTASAASTTSALFGNFAKAAIIGDRAGVRMAMSADFAFLDDVTTLRATSRYDINVHEPGDSSNAGAYVGLKTAA